MNKISSLYPIGKFILYTVVTACVIYTLTFATNIISSDTTSTIQMFFGFGLFVLTGSIVFNGIRWSVESFIDSRANSKVKENEKM